MFARRSLLICVGLLAMTLFCGNGAMGDTAALGQTGITVDRTSVHVGPDYKDRLIRVLDPGTTVQVDEARGNWLRVTLSRNGQTVEGWIEAKTLLVLDLGAPYHRALGYQGSRDVQQAMEAYTEAIETDKGNARAYYNRALLYRERDDASRVIADCTEAIKIDPQFAEAYLLRGNAYASQDAFDAACQDYGKAIAVRPKYAMAFFNRSLVKHRRSTELFAEKPWKVEEAIKLDEQAFEDFRQARVLGLPAAIARRLEDVPLLFDDDDAPWDLSSAVEAGYVRLSAHGSDTVSGMATDNFYSVAMSANTLIPARRLPSLFVASGTRLISMGTYQNMVTCEDAVMYPKGQPTSLKGVSKFHYEEEIPAAGLDAGRPAPGNADRLVGAALAGEDVQKFLIYSDYAEIYERAAIQVYERAANQEGKKGGFLDDPASMLDFHRKVRQAGVWAVTDNVSATDISGRLPEITAIHIRVAAKILDLAEIPNNLGIKPVELQELPAENLAKVLDSTLKIPLKDLAAEKKETLELARKLVSSQDKSLQEKEKVALTPADISKSRELSKQKNPVLAAALQDRGSEEKATLVLMLEIASKAMDRNDRYTWSVTLRRSVKLLTPQEQETLASALKIPSQELQESPSQDFKAAVLDPARQKLSLAERKFGELQKEARGKFLRLQNGEKKSSESKEQEKNNSELKELENKLQEQGKNIQGLQEQIKGLESEYGRLCDSEAEKVTTVFLALAQKQLVLTQKDFVAVKAFLKGLVTKERKIVEATKTPLEELSADDSDKLKQALAIIGPEQYNFALANIFLKELTSDEKETLTAMEKVRNLDKMLLDKLTPDEETAVNASQKSLDLAILILSLARGPLDRAISDEIVRRADQRLCSALNRRKAESVADDVEATIVHFRRWTPGKLRWDGVYFVDKNQRCVSWKLDNRIPLTIDPLPMQVENARAVSAKATENGVPASFGDSRFGRRVVPLPKPVGQFVEVTVRFRNTGKHSAAIQFCTPASVYAGAYLKLADYPTPNDEIGVAPVDFLLPGLAMAPESSETTKGLTLVSDLALSTAGSMGFELGNHQETCALFLFDVPRDADRFQLVILGKTIDLGLPLDPTAFEPADDRMIP